MCTGTGNLPEGERKQAMGKIIREFIDRGWLEHCHSEPVCPCFVIPKKVAREWWLVGDYRGPECSHTA